MRVGIVGAGVGGLSFARCLQQMNCGVKEVVLFEQSPQLRPNLGGSLALSGGAAVLHRVGLGSQLCEIRNFLHEIQQSSLRLHDQKDQRTSGDRLLRLHDLKSLVNRPVFLGPDGTSLIGTYMRDALQRTLVDSLEPNTVRLGRRLIGVQNKKEKVIVQVAAAGAGVVEEHEFDLLIGADGIRSETRRLLWGPFTPRYTGFQVVYVVANKSTRQHPFRVCQYYRPGALWMAASAGAPNERRDITALAYRRPSLSASPFDWLTGHASSDLAAALDQFRAPEEVRSIVQAAEKDGRLYDWPIYYQEPLRGWSKGRVALLGDSAHATSPFVGQGANQAMLDAFSLADKLQKGMGVYEALGAYESARYSETARIIKLSEMIGRIETASPPWSYARDWMFANTSFVFDAFAKSLDPKF